MSIRSLRRRRIVAGGLTLVLLLGPSTRAFAESSADRRLEALEKALKETQTRVKELEHQLDQQKAETQETQKKVTEASINAKTASADAKKRHRCRIGSLRLQRGGRSNSRRLVRCDSFRRVSSARALLRLL